MKTAERIKILTDWLGDSALYKLSKPLDGHSKVVVSAVYVPFSGPETYIFPYDDDKGDVKDYRAL